MAELSLPCYFIYYLLRTITFFKSTANTYLFEPWMNIKNTIYLNRIIKIDKIHLDKFTVECVFKTNIYYDFLNFIFAAKSGGVADYTCDSDSDSNVVYNITLWNGNQFLLKGGTLDATSIHTRKSKFLYVGLTFQDETRNKDITKFLNHYIDSFTPSASFTIKELLQILCLLDNLTIEEYFMQPVVTFLSFNESLLDISVSSKTLFDHLIL